MAGGTGFWHALTSAEQTELAECGRMAQFPAGSTMCVEGEPATHLFILTSGWVKVSVVTRDGHELVLALRGNGEVVGELADEADGYRTATMRAIVPVRALLVPHRAFSSYLEAFPAAGRAYTKAITDRWGKAAALLRTRATATGAQQLAGLLVDLASRHGVARGRSVEIEMPLSQQELASLAGISRATLARALADWRGRGLVRSSRRHITITDLDGLCALVAMLPTCSAGSSGVVPARRPGERRRAGTSQHSVT